MPGKEFGVGAAARETWAAPRVGVLVALDDEKLSALVSCCLENWPLQVRHARSRADVEGVFAEEHRVRLIFCGSGDLGAACADVVRSLLRLGWQIALMPCTAELPLLSSAVDALLSAISREWASCIDERPPLLSRPAAPHELVRGSIRIELDTDQVFVHGNPKPEIRGVLYRLFRQLVRDADGLVNRLDEVTVNEIFRGVQPSREAWNGLVFRLRQALGSARGMIVTGPTSGDVRLEKYDSY